MAAGLGSLMSSSPLTSKMWSKASMTMAAAEGTMSAVAEEEGAQQAPQQAPQQALQQTPQQTPEEEAAAEALKGLRRQCFLPVSPHEPTPQVLLWKKVLTRRPLPVVANVQRL